MEISYELKKSESLKEITAALLDFHTKVETIHKNNVNPFFKSKYADLPEILEAIRVPLLDAKLVLSHFPIGTNSLTSLLLHVSGERLEGTFSMTPIKNDPQSFGSLITYMKRYAIGCILNLNIDVDDDGNSASAKDKPPKNLNANGPQEKQKLAEIISSLNNHKHAISICESLAELESAFKMACKEFSKDKNAIKELITVKNLMKEGLSKEVPNE